MSSEQHFRKLERMYVAAPVNRYYAPEIRIREGEAEIVIPIRPDFHHAAGAVHGAVYFKCLDDSCWFAAAALVEEVCLLTSAYNIQMLRPVTEGVLRAEGRVVHRSRRVLIADGVLVDDQGRELARGSGTFMRTSIRLTEEIGYA